MATYTYAPANNSVTFGWNANSEPDIGGYNLYWGTSSGVYPNSVDVHNVLTYTLSDVFLPNTTYYFALTAYNTNSQESDFSAEIAHVVYGSIQMEGASTYTHHGSHTYASSGSIVVSGTPAYSKRKNPSTSGTMTFGGTSLSSFTSGGQFHYTASGSILMGGASDHTRDIIPTASGGMVLGGASAYILQSIRSIYSYTSLGGIEVIGSMPVSQRKVKTGDGGLVFSGNSSYQFFSNAPAPSQSYSYTSLGGMVISGNVGSQRSIIRSSDGGFGMGGTSTSFIRTFGLGSIIYEPVPDGLIEMGGSSEVLITKSYYSDGGIVMDGSSLVEPLLDHFGNLIKFRLYKRDCEVRVKEFGQDVPYTMMNPFGGPSHEEPSGAEI